MLFYLVSSNNGFEIIGSSFEVFNLIYCLFEHVLVCSPQSVIKPGKLLF